MEDNGKPTSITTQPVKVNHLPRGGNPFLRQQNILRRRLYDVVDQDCFIAIVNKFKHQAMCGDLKSAVLIFNLMGLLTHRVEANVHNTSEGITPQQARERVAAFFGIEPEQLRGDINSEIGRGENDTDEDEIIQQKKG